MTLSEISRLFIPLEIDKEHLNELISDNFKAIELNKQDRITGIRLNGLDQRVTLEMNVAGRFNGLVWVDFSLHVDNNNKKVKLEKLQIRLEESGILSRGLNWILHSAIKSRIEEFVQSQLDKNLQKLVEQYLEKDITLPLPQNLSAQLQVNDVTLHDFRFTDQSLYLNLESTGKLKLLSTKILPLASAKKSKFAG